MKRREVDSWGVWNLWGGGDDKEDDDDARARERRGGGGWGREGEGAYQ